MVGEPVFSAGRYDVYEFNGSATIIRRPVREEMSRRVLMSALEIAHGVDPAEAKRYAILYSRADDEIVRAYFVHGTDKPMWHAVLAQIIQRGAVDVGLAF